MHHLPEMNTIHQLRSSPKSTHEDNTTRVINHLVVDDNDQISIVSPVNELNKEVNVLWLMAHIKLINGEYLYLKNFIIPRSLISNNVFQFVLPQLGI